MKYFLLLLSLSLPGLPMNDNEYKRKELIESIINILSLKYLPIKHTNYCFEAKFNSILQESIVAYRTFSDDCEAIDHGSLNENALDTIEHYLWCLMVEANEVIEKEESQLWESLDRALKRSQIRPLAQDAFETLYDHLVPKVREKAPLIDDIGLDALKQALENLQENINNLFDNPIYSPIGIDLFKRAICEEIKRMPRYFFQLYLQCISDLIHNSPSLPNLETLSFCRYRKQE